jgi:hypothetical protein
MNHPTPPVFSKTVPGTKILSADHAPEACGVITCISRFGRTGTEGSRAGSTSRHSHPLLDVGLVVWGKSGNGKMVVPATYPQSDPVAHDLEKFTVRLDSSRGRPNPGFQEQAGPQAQKEKRRAENGHGNANDSGKKGPPVFDSTFDLFGPGHSRIFPFSECPIEVKHFTPIGTDLGTRILGLLVRQFGKNAFL